MPIGEVVAARIYRFLLLALPKEFRQAYATDAANTFRDLYRNARVHLGVSATLGVCRRAVIQTLGGGIAERWARFRRLSPTGSDKNNQRASMHRKSFATFDDLMRDVRYTIRSFRKTPSFYVTALLILALGIGATTTIFSVVDAVLLRDMPYPDAHELVFFDQGNHAAPDYRDWLERLTTFEQIAAVRREWMDLTNEGDPVRIAVAGVTPSFFPMLGAVPSMGRLIDREDAHGLPTVAVVSHEFWRERWGADSSIIGRSLDLDDQTVTVVGIMSPRFIAPELVTRSRPDIWTPLDATRPDMQRRGYHVLSVVGRLADGVSLAAAQAEMHVWELWAKDEFPETNQFGNDYRRVPLLVLHEATVGQIQTTLFMLLGAVGLMLLIACANVANLFLARGTDREREMAVRAALGASRPRIVSQLLTESLVLALASGALGAALTYAGVRAFGALHPGNIPRFEQVSVDLRVLGFAVLASVATGVLFGVAPAFYSARANVNDALKEAVKSTAGRTRLRLKNALVVVEIAVALVLLVGAGLLFNSFVRLNQVDVGFNSENLIVASLALGPKYDDVTGSRVQFGQDLLERVRTIPGVQMASVGVTSPFAFRGRCCWGSWLFNAAGDSVRVTIRPVDTGFLETLGAQLIQGRTIEPADASAGTRMFSFGGGAIDPSVAVVSDRVSEALFPETGTVGQQIRLGAQQLSVIGLVRDLRHFSLATDNDADIYVPHALFGQAFPFLELVMRTAGTVEIGGAVRRAVWDLDPLMPVPEITPVRERIANSIADRQFVSTLLLTFAALAMLLAAGGIYGAMLYAVTQRNREFGIRIALGANGGQLIRQVVAQGAALTAFGVGLGLAGAYALSRILKSMVFGISTTDAATFSSVAVLLAAVAIAACYIPARRAAGTNPVDTLRLE